MGIRSGGLCIQAFYWMRRIHDLDLALHANLLQDIHLVQPIQGTTSPCYNKPSWVFFIRVDDHTSCTSSELLDDNWGRH